MRLNFAYSVINHEIHEIEDLRTLLAIWYLTRNTILFACNGIVNYKCNELYSRTSELVHDNDLAGISEIVWRLTKICSHKKKVLLHVCVAAKIWLSRVFG